MFLAMNRFKIVKGCEEDFEKIWRERDTHLQGVEGFKEFNLMKGNTEKDYSLYASHSIWESEYAFIDWTKSEAFKLAHKNAGIHRDLYLGPPNLEIFDQII